MSSMKYYTLLVLLLAGSQQSDSFDPDEITPVVQYGNPNCGDDNYDDYEGDYGGDYESNYGGDYPETGVLSETGR